MSSFVSKPRCRLLLPVAELAELVPLFAPPSSGATPAKGPPPPGGSGEGPSASPSPSPPPSPTPCLLVLSCS